MPGNYTRTLVGPLTANAAKLYDDKKEFGIFFTFQDLSVRTEGARRLFRARHVLQPNIVIYRHVPPSFTVDQRWSVSAWKAIGLL